MRRLAPTFLRPMARLCVVHVIVIQDGVQTSENFAPSKARPQNRMERTIVPWQSWQWVIFDPKSIFANFGNCAFLFFFCWQSV